MKNRTILRAIKRIAAVFGCAAILAGGIEGAVLTKDVPVAQAAKKNSDADSELWPDGIYDLDIYAESAILMDVNSGLILYEKNAKKKQFPASITKIPTCLVALENTSLNDIITFSTNAVYGIEPGSAHIACEVGEEMTMEECYYGMMLASANEVCMAVAEHVGGTVEGFADMLNKKSEELGCVNSHWVTPNGLHDEEHYTCAYDMALIARAAFQYETFRTVCNTRYHVIPPDNKKEERPIVNAHQMISGNKFPQYKYEYCAGGKTGYTDQSGNTLVTYAQKDGITLVCVVLKDRSPAYPTNEYTDTISLFDYAFEHYSMVDVNTLTQPDELIEKDSTLFTKFSPLFDENNQEITTPESGAVLLPNGADASLIEQTVEYYDTPVEMDDSTIIGDVTYSYGGKVVGQSNIIYKKAESNRLVTNTKKQTEVKSTIVDEEEKKNLKPFLIIMIIGIIVIIVLIAALFLMRRRRAAAEFSFYRNRYGRGRKGGRNSRNSRNSRNLRW